MAIFTFLPKSGPYLTHFAPVPSGPGGRGTQIFFFKVGNRPQEAMQKKILEFSPPISDICLYLPFSTQTQLAVFRIEYNAFSKAKFWNFQNLLILNIYLQTIIMSEKTQFELNLTSFK